MLFLDLLFIWLANKIWPDEPVQATRGNAESCQNWIILDELEGDGKLNEIKSNDPYLNGDYDDGPGWDC